MGATPEPSGRTNRHFRFPAALSERYTVERILGEGGMAVVHLAEERKHRQTALDWCEAAVEERRGWVGYLAVHPLVDSLRKEPRFRELLRKLGLAEIRAAT
jgi:hypothetical protein